MAEMSRILAYGLAVLAVGCGTVVGNPKKPADPGEPKPAVTVYTLPLLEFDIGDTASADEPSLKLQGEGDADRTVLAGWGRRLERVIGQVNALSERVNRKAAALSEESSSDVQVFSGHGAEGRISGKLMPLPTGTDYAYAAVLCQDGRPFTRFLWSADGSRVSLARDFAPAFEDGVETFSLRSEVTIVKGAATTLTIRNEGEWSDEEGGTSHYLAEYTEATKSEAGEISLKAVAERDTARPEVFDGDSYLVAKITPTDVVEAGRRKMLQAFVGYDRRFDVLCAAGFDEAATDLWRPDFQGPRFCLGRPAGGRRFGSVAAFYATLADLEPIGLAGKAELRTVAVPEDLSCAP